MQKGIDLTISVSGIICVYTEERWDDILRAIFSLRSQTLKLDEIIVVVDYNKILAERLFAADLDVMLINNSGPKGLSGARNSGIAVCRSEFVVFLDDDGAAEPNWIEVMVEHFKNPLVMGVGSWVEPLWSPTKPKWFPAEYFWVVGCSYVGLPNALSDVRSLFGGSMVIRRSLFSIIGGFDARLGRAGSQLPLGCEETELCIRARVAVEGACFLFEPSVRITHRVNADRSTIRYFFLRCYAEGFSKYQLTKICGDNLGLSSERRFLTSVLPRAVFQEAQDFIRGDWAALLRICLLLGGFGSASAGFTYAMMKSLFTGRNVVGRPNRAEG